MNDRTVVRVHWSFWLIAILALIWHLLGVANVAVQLSAPNLEAFPEWWRQVVESRPAWATIAAVVAVVCGALGCVFLLLSRSIAFYVFIVALVGAVLTMSHALGVGEPGPRQIVEGVVMPIAVGVFMIWYSRFADRKGWLV